MEKLPAAYLHEIKEQLGEEFEEYLQSFFCPYSALCVLIRLRLLRGLIRQFLPGI